jgi:hypothetical protein
MPEDNPPDIRWLSYQEIAVARGISRTSAERMVRRAKWRRQVDNQGVTKAAVPLSYLERDPADPPDRPPDRQGENLPGNGLLHDAVRAFEASIATLTEQLARERDRSDKSVAAMIETEKAVGDLRRKLDASQTSLAAAEAGAAELRDQLEQTRAQAQDARQRAEATDELVRRLEAERRARPLLQRLLSAIRGT